VIQNVYYLFAESEGKSLAERDQEIRTNIQVSASQIWLFREDSG
jgi:hypothetical protein